MRKKILLIDDEPDIVKVMATRLRVNGFDVITATGGAEGIEKAEKKAPDLILLDVLMPGMDGLTVLAKLKESSKTRAISVIMLTARGQIGDVSGAVDFGALDYLVKPFNSEELLEKVSKALS